MTHPGSEKTLSSLFAPDNERGNGRGWFLSVLCVSCDPLFLDRICRNLERNGDIFVETCTSAEDALHLMDYLFFDAVVTDCTEWQGEPNGFLKAMRKQGTETPFIYFIRRLETGIRRDARRYGRIRYLGWRQQASSPPFDKLARCIHRMTAVSIENEIRNASGWRYPACGKTF